MIYFLQAKDGGPIKVGSSENPNLREKQIAALFPYGVDLLATIDGGKMSETFIHHCFRPLVVNTATEWFRAAPPLWRFLLDIIDNGRPSFVPDERKFLGDNLENVAVAEFGGVDEAKARLGYSKATTDVFKGNYAGAFAMRARICFVQSFQRGLLPPYITALHGGGVFAQARSAA